MPASRYPPLPAFVRRCTQADVADQRIPWSWAKEPWPQAFRDHAQLGAELEAEARDHGGIRRELVFSHADGDPGRAVPAGNGVRVRADHGALAQSAHDADRRASQAETR